MKVTALLLIAIVCVSSTTVYKRLGKSQTMAALAQVPYPFLPLTYPSIRRLTNPQSPTWFWVNYKFTSLPKVLLMMLLLLSTTWSLKNRVSKLPLTLNITKILLSARERSPLLLPTEIPTPPPRPSVSKPSSTPRLSLPMPRPSSLRPSKLLLSWPNPSKTVPLSELSRLLTTLWAKLNTRRPSTPLVKLLELLAIYNREEAGSNLKVKLKKSLKNYNRWPTSPNSTFMAQWLSLSLSSPLTLWLLTLFKKSSISLPSLETTSNTLKIKKLL